jgi:hypothetical protein
VWVRRELQRVDRQLPSPAPFPRGCTVTPFAHP